MVEGIRKGLPGLESHVKQAFFGEFRKMTHETLNPFRFAKYESVHGIGSRNRGSRRAGRVLAAILSVGLAILPVSSAFADDQVLEIPQVTSVPSASPSYTTHSYPRHSSTKHSSIKHTGTSYSGRDAYSSATPDSHPEATAGAGGPADSWDRVASNEKSYAPDPNVGSISDYQNQPDESGQPARISFGGGARRNEPQSSMATNLIVGGLIVGLMALEIASHHNHR